MSGGSDEDGLTWLLRAQDMRFYGIGYPTLPLLLRGVPRQDNSIAWAVRARMVRCRREQARAWTLWDGRWLSPRCAPDRRVLVQNRSTERDAFGNTPAYGEARRALQRDGRRPVPIRFEQYRLTRAENVAARRLLDHRSILVDLLPILQDGIATGGRVLTPFDFACPVCGTHLSGFDALFPHVEPYWQSTLFMPVVPHFHSPTLEAREIGFDTRYAPVCPRPDCRRALRERHLDQLREMVVMQGLRLAPGCRIMLPPGVKL